MNSPEMSLCLQSLNFKPEMVGMLDGSKPNARRIVSGEGPVTPVDDSQDVLADFVEVDLSKHNEAPEAEEELVVEAQSRPEKGEAAKRWGLENEIGRNEPCPCGSGMKFKMLLQSRAEFISIFTIRRLPVPLNGLIDQRLIPC